jgi:hypothetical protein
MWMDILIDPYAFSRGYIATQTGTRVETAKRPVTTLTTIIME